jgi:hypothetical protein
MAHLSLSQSFLVPVPKLAVRLQPASPLSPPFSPPHQYLASLQATVILALKRNSACGGVPRRRHNPPRSSGHALPAGGLLPRALHATSINCWALLPGPASAWPARPSPICPHVVGIPVPVQRTTCTQTAGRRRKEMCMCSRTRGHANATTVRAGPGRAREGVAAVRTHDTTTDLSDATMMIHSERN